MKTIVALRKWHEDNKIKYSDKSIVCLDCGDKNTDLVIVKRSENGQRIKAGLINCGSCGKKIK